MKNIEHKLQKSGVWLQILIILILTLAMIFVYGYVPGKSCTIFTVVDDGLVLYGNNEDQHNPDPVLGIYPPSSEGYGSIHFGTRGSDGQVNFEGAVNDQGLAWDVNSTPSFKLVQHPEKPYYLGSQNFLYTITKKAATVDEAIQIAQRYQFGDVMESQIHIADAAGDAVVISAGPDGEIAFNRKHEGDGYYLSTNFNLAVPDKGPVDFRWETASSMLNSLDHGRRLTHDYAIAILDAVKLKTITSYTLYSNVLDLKNNKIYLTYMSQFDEPVEIDMQDAFTNGRQTLAMREYFSHETAMAGDLAYQKFEARFLIAKIVVITILFLIIIGVIYLGSRIRVRNGYQTVNINS